MLEGLVCLMLGTYTFWLAKVVVNNLCAFSHYGKVHIYEVFYSYKYKGVCYKLNGTLGIKRTEGIMVITDSILKTATFATYFVSSPLLLTFTCDRENCTTNNEHVIYLHIRIQNKR